MQPYTSVAMIAAVMPGRTLVQEVTVSDQPEAELLAAELAVLHAPVNEPLHLRVDCRNAYLSLSGRDPGAWVLRHRAVADRILALAASRGITLHVEHIPGEVNRAHVPALSALRQADTRPKVEIHLHVQGKKVRVRGNGIKFDGTYAAPATLHALVALADALPPQVIALVYGIAPLAETYWMGSPNTPSEIRRLVQRAKQGLGRKRSDLRPAHTWWLEARTRR